MRGLSKEEHINGKMRLQAEDGRKIAEMQKHRI